jgi:ATP-dependent DNA helicase RecG
MGRRCNSIEGEKVNLRKVSPQDALALVDRQESHFWDHKSATSKGATIQKIAVALANADGGDFIVGVEDRSKGGGIARWVGFPEQEDANLVLEALGRDCDPPIPYEIEYLEIAGEAERGLACLVSVRKSASVHYTAGKAVFVRRGTSSVEIHGHAITDLALSKGARSYEDQVLERYSLDDIVEAQELLAFLQSYSPQTPPRDFVRKQGLVKREADGVRVAGAVMYADVPPAVMPKRCSIKIARYNTRVSKPSRDHLDGTPTTIEGPARQVIEEAIHRVTELVESVSVLQPDGSFVPMAYPPEAVKEIIVNAVIHRDYNLADDILIYVFDNRVEVRSPGVLPGHMTLDNLHAERFSRNPTIVRLLNKYPDPPNKDIGEGLRTAREKMLAAKLKEPTFAIEGTYFIATLGHTPLARPHEIVMEYLGSHEEITYAVARSLTGITSENSMKDVFYALRDAGRIEMHPDRRGNKSSWRLVKARQELPSQLSAQMLFEEGAPSLVDNLERSVSAPRRRRPGRRTERSGRAPGRNLPCPCGSGLKYKRCHGLSGDRMSM